MAFFDPLRQDVRGALRSLRSAPTVTAPAILTLALGIGASTTIFSLLEAVLLRRLPVAAPEHLYFVAHGTAEAVSVSSNYPWFARVAQHTDIFAGVTAYNVRDLKVASPDGVETVVGQYASGNYHALIGVRFQLGRGLNAEDDRVMSPIAVLSDGYWSRRFGRSPDVLGRSLVVGNHAVTIVGITAAGFDGMQPGRSIDMTLPLSLWIHDDPEFVSRTDTWTSIPLVARLKPGVTVAAARAAIASSYRDFMMRPENQEFSRTSSGRVRAATLQPAAQGSDQLRRTYQRPLQVLMGMVGVVLLIACVNVANLLLTRAPARAREVAVRMSVGASRSRIARQLLTESVLLSVCGGALGVLLAGWGTAFVAALLRTGLRPIIIDVEPDGRVLLFATVVSVLTGIAFGIAPALKTTAIDLAATLKSGGTSRWHGRRRFGQQTLVAAQIAMCLILVFGAGLLARTLRNLRGVDAGFRQDAVVLLELDARDTPFDPARLEALCGDLIGRMNARPEVLSGTCSTMSPVATNTEGRAVTIHGASGAPVDPPIAFANSVDAGYFETLGIEVIRGRAFSAADHAASMKVAVISDAMARYYFAQGDPVGRTFSFGRSNPGPPITIVGVARSARQQLRDMPVQMVYTPLSQREEPANGLLAAIRTSGETAAVVAAVRGEVGALTRDVAVPYVRTMDEQIDAALVGERLLATLASSFAVLALMLACIGLYGVMSFDVARRSRDIAIRLALGARRQHVFGQVLWQVSLVTILGVAAGAVGAIASARMLSSVLFGLASNDLGTLLLATTGLCITAAVAGYLPARRAAQVDPAVTLRTE